MDLSPFNKLAAGTQSGDLIIYLVDDDLRVEDLNVLAHSSRINDIQWL